MTKLKKYLQSLKNKNIHIVGVAGTEGAEIALFLQKHKINNLTLHDFSKTESEFETNFQKAHSSQDPSQTKQKLNQLKTSNYPLNLQPNYLQNIDQADLIFLPQSWFLYPQNESLKKLTPKISTLTELYLKLLPCPVIGITGSNGKSTTTFLTFHLLKNLPHKTVFLTGNDRRATQILNNLDQIKPTDLVVTEISNRQLFNLKDQSPHIAVLLNITENHLAEHTDFQEYINAKAQITKFQTTHDHFIYNTDNQICQNIAKHSQAKLHSFGTSSQNPCHFDQNFIYLHNQKLLPLNQLPLQGQHNYQNICAAILAAHLAGQSTENIITNLQTFQGLPQRIEKLNTPKNSKNLTFYDDRQGTSTAATIQALNTVPKPTTIILGGQNKKMPTNSLIKTLNQPNTITVGIDSPFYSEIKSTLNNTHQVKTLTQAIELAIKISPAGSNILFSPACEYGPYFNQLPGYDDAEKFKEIVQKIINSSNN
jgi:UDP-N-acetylmuramoylalanine--D-glutamate ligase